MSASLSEFLQQFVTEERLQRFDSVLANRTRHVAVVLENIHHAHNASACLRTCDCFGVQDVHIVESENRFQPNEDIALGASRWLTLHRYQVSEETPFSATAECLEQLRHDGYRIVATSPRQDSIPVSDIDVSQKTAVVFGAEQQGISDEVISKADQLVHIPMYGFTESFNISVSVALVLQQLTGLLRNSETNWRLPAHERAVLKDAWVRQTLGYRLDPLIRRFNRDRQRV